MRQQLVGDGCHICNPHEIGISWFDGNPVEAVITSPNGHETILYRDEDWATIHHIRKLEEKVRLQLDKILSLDADKKELEARARELERSDTNVGFEPLLRVCSVDGNADGKGLPTSITIERADNGEVFARYVPDERVWELEQKNDALSERVRELESAILDYMAANREVDEGSDNFNGEIDALNACWVKMTRIVDPPKAE